jgi:subtilisin family serine protease
MKAVKLTSLFLAGAVGLAACSDDSTKSITGADLNAPAFSAQANNDAQPTGRHLVVFSSNNKVPADFGQRVAGLGGSVVSEYGRIGVAVVSGLSDEAAAQLQAFDDTQTVEHDLEVQYVDPISDMELIAADDASPASAANPATASFYPRQWHLRAIGAEKAWAAGKLGSSNVTVAILDTGISPTHPDLVGRVDMIRSRSFVPSDAAVVQANFPGMPNWVDLHYHGTHVAATVSSNARAAAGVTSGVTLMAVKVLSRTGSGSSSGILAGIMHAADNDADVINMSLGGTFRKSLNPGYVSVINRAINYANREGVVMVVSAGNDNYNLDSDSDIYKTYCMATHVICTSATGPTAQAGTNGPWTDIDAKASYSNFGSYVSVAAPGGNGASRVTAACSQQSLNIPVCRTGAYVIGISGTSMASPHASGLAALLVEEIGKNRPSQVANRMAQSADDLGDEGRDVIYGRGRINVAKALGL